MGYKFKCQKCGNDIIVKYCTIGEPVQCKSCGASNVVPEDAIETTKKPEYLLRYESRRRKNTFLEFQKKPRTKEIVITLGVLGPRDFGEIISEIFRIYAKNFLKLIALVAIVVLIVNIPIIILSIVAAFQYTKNTLPLWYFPVMFFTPLVFSTVTTPLEICVLVYAVSEQYISKTINIRRAYRWAFSRLGTAIGAEILAGLAYLGLIIVVIGIPFGIYLSYLWIFMFPVALIEGVNPRKVLSRSSTLVQDHWWRIFGIILVISTIGLIILFILRLIPFVGLLIGSILALPIYGVGITLLYFDMRVRKEGYTTEKLAEDLGLKLPSSGNENIIANKK